MKSHSELRVFQELEVRVWQKASHLIGLLPDDPELRCHELAHALGIYFRGNPLRIQVEDGRYGLVNHSWLYWLGPSTYTILDPYCIGRLPMVQLIHMNAIGLGHNSTYNIGPARTDIDHTTVQRLLGVWDNSVTVSDL